MHFKLSKDNLKEFFLMLGSVFMMGFALSLLVLTNFGTDPWSAMNYGITRTLVNFFGSSISLFGLQIPITFGNYQVFINLLLLILIFFTFRTSIGFGTLGNMIVVGYTADFFSFIWHQVCRIPDTLPLATRLLILIPGVLLFVFSAATYMHSGLGMAPYDSIPFLIDHVIEKKTGKSHFKIVRYTQDFFCTFIAFLLGGEYGLMTILMDLLLAPTVSFVGNLFKHPKENE